MIGGRDLWRQRVRWAEGALRTNLEWTLPMLRSDHESAATRAERLLYAAQLLLPFVTGGAFLTGLRRRRAAAAIAIPAAYLAGVIAIGMDSLPRVPGASALTIGSRVRRSTSTALFMSLWMAAVPRAAARIALGRGPLRYEPTPHLAERPPS